MAVIPYDILDEKREAPERPVLLTFDDGHWDLYTDILPILQKYHVKATAYIAPGLLNGSDFLTIEQLEKVATNGAVEIAAHTAHHVWLKGKSLELVRREIKDSKDILEWGGQKHKRFRTPFKLKVRCTC